MPIEATTNWLRGFEPQTETARRYGRLGTQYRNFAVCVAAARTSPSIHKTTRKPIDQRLNRGGSVAILHSDQIYPRLVIVKIFQ